MSTHVNALTLTLTLGNSVRVHLPLMQGSHAPIGVLILPLPATRCRLLSAVWSTLGIRDVPLTSTHTHLHALRLPSFASDLRVSPATRPGRPYVVRHHCVHVALRVCISIGILALARLNRRSRPMSYTYQICYLTYVRSILLFNKAPEFIIRE